VSLAPLENDKAAKHLLHRLDPDGQSGDRCAQPPPRSGGSWPPATAAA
jgi:hypothetical protein